MHNTSPFRSQRVQQLQGRLVGSGSRPRARSRGVGEAWGWWCWQLGGEDIAEGFPEVLGQRWDRGLGEVTTFIQWRVSCTLCCNGSHGPRVQGLSLLGLMKIPTGMSTNPRCFFMLNFFRSNNAPGVFLTDPAQGSTAPWARWAPLHQVTPGV